ncbi:hypothetical protein TCON_0574 [Astathelohania contejeani]|uniref:Uncharacterized protein n=1 Tax=Astathelohania contejeani TaxID=164912 RepID=A0ABQ7I1F1_9MICR|nr:hypothetical protein TCON_0574 [Thelohania contejeani]
MKRRNSTQSPNKTPKKKTSKYKIYINSPNTNLEDLKFKSAFPSESTDDIRLESLINNILNQPDPESSVNFQNNKNLVKRNKITKDIVINKDDDTILEYSKHTADMYMADSDSISINDKTAIQLSLITTDQSKEKAQTDVVIFKNEKTRHDITRTKMKEENLDSQNHKKKEIHTNEKDKMIPELIKKYLETKIEVNENKEKESIGVKKTVECIKKEHREEEVINEILKECEKLIVDIQKKIQIHYKNINNHDLMKTIQELTSQLNNRNKMIDILTRKIKEKEQEIEILKDKAEVINTNPNTKQLKDSLDQLIENVKITKKEYNLEINELTKKIKESKKENYLLLNKLQNYKKIINELVNKIKEEKESKNIIEDLREYINKNDR